MLGMYTAQCKCGKFKEVSEKRLAMGVTACMGCTARMKMASLSTLGS
jgi:hypothetical protein